MSSSDDFDGQSIPPTKKTKFQGAAEYKTKFRKEFVQKYPFIAPVSDVHHYRCNVCAKTLSCGHQGERDIKRHIDGDMHKKADKVATSQQSIFKLFEQKSTLNEKVIRAEVKTAYMLAHHNIPLATADHLSPLFEEIFPDRDIAKAYSSARTKTTCMLNLAVAQFFQSALVEMMKAQLYALATDGSNDTGLEKMNPLTVRIYNVNNKRVETQLLDMCISRGASSATAAAIFDKIDEKITGFEIPWSNCVAFGVDNTSVNLGNRNSIKTRALQKNGSCYFMGCPCHLDTSGNLLSIAYMDRDNQKDDSSLFVGLMTRGKLAKLLDDGDIDGTSQQRFFGSAREVLHEGYFRSFGELLA
ncbi:hypothetical protein ScPMuIL_004896 [Solemya velum]